MACALAASQGEASVVVLERDHYRGRTILASGNGRCNFSHDPINPCCYFNHEFVESVHRCVSDTPSVPSVLSWFDSLGLVWQEMPKGSGMLYPYSNRATAVTDVLNARFENSDVSFYGNACVSKIEKQGDSWSIEVGDCALHADVVVLACGGNALQDVAFLCDRELVLKPCHGVLGPLEVKEAIPDDLDGLRAEVALRVNGFQETGEVLFRSYGLSGIVAFNASRHIENNDCMYMNCAPSYTTEQLYALFEKRLQLFSGESLVHACRGFIDLDLARFACTQAKLDPESRFNQRIIPKLVHALTNVAFSAVAVAGNQPCQVQRGGVAVDSIDPETMSCLWDPTLFVLGEALDVDGPCGGYNLDWAWTTGLVAGTALARRFS